MQEFALLLLGFPAFHRQHALFCGDGDLVGCETRDRQRDLVAVLAQAFDVARWIIVLRTAVLRGIHEVEQAVKADGRSPKGSKIVGSPHSQILR
jgi:hypothetical protein